MAEGEEVGKILTSLEMPQYIDRFVNEGFDNWTTICDITEADLNHMDVRLGHRRKLLRSIHESRHRARQHSSQASSIESAINDLPRAQHESPRSSRDDVHQSQERPKRKYKRHPKPDLNAPIKPACAYALFAQDVRDQLKHQTVGFPTMAKAIGSRWQTLPVTQRETYNRAASSTKELFLSETANYRKTKEYEQYQEYLHNFKKQQGGKNAKT